jgi:hypothetical protein
MYRILLLLVTLALFQPAASAQEVWPGDVNNNGVVNGVDLLYWGVAFGTNGPARATTSTNWSAQPPGAPWAQSFPSGLNYAFADCDGNGEINEEDFDNAIEENFGLTHGVLGPDGFANAIPGAAPRLRMVPSATLVEEGAIIDIELFLDDSDLTVNDFYGIALKMTYTTGILMGDSGPDFDFTEDSWLEAGDDNAQELFEDGDGSGFAELAFTRTNLQSVAVGTEAIGVFSVIVEDIIVGLAIDTFVIQIDSVLLVGPNLSAIETIPDTVRIVVAKDTSMLTSTNDGRNSRQLAESIANSISVFPNPTRSDFHLASPVPVTKLVLVDHLGRRRELSPPGVRQRVQLPPNLPTGLYCLLLETPYGNCLKRILITR